HGTDVMANVWMHNGFLQVEGKKMSKSDGNFVTIHELLHTDKFGGRKWPGEVLRLAMLMTHYREPIDFSVRRLEEAERTLLGFCENIKAFVYESMGHINFAPQLSSTDVGEADPRIRSALLDDLNTVSAVTLLHEGGGDGVVAAGLNLLGIDWRGYARRLSRESFGLNRDFGISEKISQRLAFLAAKDFANADRIRNELLEQGIQLKDGKDPVTGERVTTWEVKR
ncbi:MAG: cysteine--tRNA ligase, partial [Rhizobiaceae bacterium]